MESLANNHPFLDGNKRVAFAVAHTFLLVNGCDLELGGLGTEAQGEEGAERDRDAGLHRTMITAISASSVTPLIPRPITNDAGQYSRRM